MDEIEHLKGSEQRSGTRRRNCEREHTVREGSSMGIVKVRQASGGVATSASLKR